MTTASMMRGLPECEKQGAELLIATRKPGAYATTQSHLKPELGPNLFVLLFGVSLQVRDGRNWAFSVRPL
jgi:hypothetical protein